MNRKERIREKVREIGIEELCEEEVLEYVLGINIKDGEEARKAAERLLERFGTMKAIFTADEEELKREGMLSGDAALYISIYRETYTRIQRESVPKIMDSYEKAGAYLIRTMAHKPSEELRLISIDGRGRFIRDDLISEGQETQVTINMKKIVKAAIQRDAVYAIMAHNHPSGDASPSMQDIRMTRMAYETLTAFGIKLLDHIVVGGERAYSMWQNEEGVFSENADYLEEKGAARSGKYI